MHKLLTTCALLGAAALVHAQTFGDLGRDIMPAPDESIGLPPNHGELYDMTGGYALGATVADFTLWNADGMSFNLSDMLTQGKPVVLISGSVTCDKFANTFRLSYEGQLSLDARAFLEGSQEDLAYVFIYGMEAHPTSGACPTNCPPAQTTDTLVAQHNTYADRLAALTSWTTATDIDFSYTMFADNPDNAVYNTYFERPNGVLGINCDGTVGLRADWMTSFLGTPEGQDQTIAWATAQATCYAENATSNLTATPGRTSLVLVPNPAATGTAARVIGASTLATIEVRDALGRLHHRTRGTTTLPPLPRGHYFVTVTEAEARTTLRWVID